MNITDFTKDHGTIKESDYRKCHDYRVERSHNGFDLILHFLNLSIK